MRILVGIDGSSDARAAVGWLGHLPLPAGHTVRIVTVVIPRIASVDTDKAQAVRDGLIAEARRLVDDTASELRVGGEAARGEVVEDDARGDRRHGTRLGRGSHRDGSARPWRCRSALPRQRLPRRRAAGAVLRARLQRTDLVVLGARGLGVVSRLLLGSVSESVLTHAACSVLIARPG